jgi:hypothetical protein
MPRTISAADHEWWTERAAIREESGEPRAKAELRA